MQEAAEDASLVKRRRRSADLHHAGSAQYLHHARTALIPMPSPSHSSEEKQDKQTATTATAAKTQNAATTKTVMWQTVNNNLLVIYTFSIAMTTVIACVHM